MDLQAWQGQVGLVRHDLAWQARLGEARQGLDGSGLVWQRIAGRARIV